MISNNTEFHSEPVQEIMGAIPSWITRWGIAIIASIFTLLIIGCYLIKYPQTVSSTIRITSSNPPSNLTSRYTGILDTVAVMNGQLVNSGDLIALMYTPAKYEDVESVKAFLSKAASGEIRLILEDTIWSSELHLGDLQAEWAELCSLHDEYSLFCNLDELGAKIRQLSDLIARNKDYYQSLFKQSQTIAQDLKLQERALKRDSALFSKHAISEYEFEVSQQAFVSKLGSMAGFESSMKSVNISIIQLSQSLEETRLLKESQSNNYIIRIRQAMQRLSNSIDLWEDKYAIISPSSGRISLGDYWTSGQHVNSGDIVASVVPLQQEIIVGRLKVPSAGFGKVKPGQRVNIQLNGFPYMEYGILKGEISRISSVPEHDQDGGISYSVEVIFPDGLVSTYGQLFPLIQDMDGKAEIITQDMRLIQQLLSPIKSLFRNK